VGLTLLGGFAPWFWWLLHARSGHYRVEGTLS
jgi:hypothetical protein